MRWRALRVGELEQQMRAGDLAFERRHRDVHDRRLAIAGGMPSGSSWISCAEQVSLRSSERRSIVVSDSALGKQLGDRAGRVPGSVPPPADPARRRWRTPRTGAHRARRRRSTERRAARPDRNATAARARPAQTPWSASGHQGPAARGLRLSCAGQWERGVRQAPPRRHGPELRTRARPGRAVARRKSRRGDVQTRVAVGIAHHCFHDVCAPRSGAAT